jgi:hypothetical protein
MSDKHPRVSLVLPQVNNVLIRIGFFQTEVSHLFDSFSCYRAVFVDLTGDGRKSILTARAKLSKVRGKDDNSLNTEESLPKNGQLVWLEMPKPHHFDETTGTPLEEDGTTFDPFSARHLPWQER